MSIPIDHAGSLARQLRSRNWVWVPQLEITCPTTAEPASSRAHTPQHRSWHTQGTSYKLQGRPSTATRHFLHAARKTQQSQNGQKEREEIKVQGNEELDPRFMWRSFDTKFSVQLTGRMVMSPRKVDKGSDTRGIIGLVEVLMSLFESVLCSFFFFLKSS